MIHSLTIALPRFARTFCLAMAFFVSSIIPLRSLHAEDAVVAADPGVDAEIARWLDEANFNRWVFNSVAGGSPTPAAAARTALTDRGNSEIALADRMFHLTAAQKHKLELAARGDLNRLFEHVETTRKGWLNKRRTQAEFRTFWNDIQQLQVFVSTEKFGSGSMYRKMLLNILTPEQKTTYFTAEKSRRDRRNRARVANALIYLESVVPLETSQRQKLGELIGKETERMVDSAGHYQSQVVLYRISRIPEDKLRTVLDATQLRAVVEKLRSVRANGHWLDQQGLLRDEPRDDDLVDAQLSKK